MKLPLCVIVGFGSGHGLALAKAFGREGFQLALLLRSEQAPFAGRVVGAGGFHRELFCGGCGR